MPTILRQVQYVCKDFLAPLDSVPEQLKYASRHARAPDQIMRLPEKFDLRIARYSHEYIICVCDMPFQVRLADDNFLGFKNIFAPCRTIARTNLTFLLPVLFASLAQAKLQPPYTHPSRSKVFRYRSNSSTTWGSSSRHRFNCPLAPACSILWAAACRHSAATMAAPPVSARARD